MLFRNSLRNLPSVVQRYTHIQTELVPKEPTKELQTQLIDIPDLSNDDFIDLPLEKKSVLEECSEDISHIAPYLKPTFNFAAYVNKSQTLQELVSLGVDLSKLDKRAEVPFYILKLDFEKDLKNHVIFLSDVGVLNEEIGNFITKNPYIFKEDLENLQVRINYLKSKRFSNPMITRIVSGNPYWLNYSTQKIDRRLGFFQKHFSLSGNEIRALTTLQPRIITYSLYHIKLNTFSIKEEMGFTSDETKKILLKKPYIFMKTHENLLRTFEFVHKTMKIPLERIVDFPETLTCREFRIKQRHMFLVEQGKALYNPLKPNYVSLVDLISGSDSEFCENVAKSSIQAFNAFLKSL